MKMSLTLLISKNKEMFKECSKNTVASLISDNLSTKINMTVMDYDALNKMGNQKL